MNEVIYKFFLRQPKIDKSNRDDVLAIGATILKLNNSYVYPELKILGDYFKKFMENKYYENSFSMQRLFWHDPFYKENPEYMTP